MNQDRHAPANRREDHRLLTGRGEYTDDILDAGALHVAFVRSPYPSALVRSLDVSAALAHPGAVAVLTGADMAAEGFNDCPVPFQLPQGDGTIAYETPRQFMVRDRVRCVGEPVAMILAETLTQAMDASELVMVDYEELPAVIDPFAAAKPDAPQLWDNRPGNVAYHWRGGDMGKVDAALAAAHRVVRLRSHVSRVGAMPIEPRSALAFTGDDGRPVLRAAHQHPFQLRQELATLFRLDVHDLRVLAGDVGGSFGLKLGQMREEILVFWAARRIRRAVRWTAQRSEAFLSDEHSRDVHIESELGLDADGRFTALKVRYDVNVGTYMTFRSSVPVFNIGGISGVYTTPAVAAEIYGIFTNTQATCAYRGAGRPDATYAIERIIDVAAAEMGIDPAELRRRNLIPKESMPYRTSFLYEYDSGDFAACLARALELADYANFAQRRTEAGKRGRLRGFGIAMPIETAAGRGTDLATVQAHSDGTVTLLPGAMSVGQGHETGFTRLVAKILGLPQDRVRYLQGDTDLLENGRGNGGSSALALGGPAITRGVDDLIAKAKLLASRKLEVVPDDVVFAEGVFRVVGTDRMVTLAEVARMSEASSGEQLAGSGEFTAARPTFPNGCHICEVEIEPDTGLVTPIRYISVEDVGRVLNPVLVEGQIHGGVAQGMGQALLEQISYDDSGQLVTGSFMDYAMPRAADLPEMLCENLEVPTALNSLGVKGVGEAGTVGGLSATMNAVCHALQPAGIRHLDMPTTPMRVWQALRDAGYFASATKEIQ
jgi:carbon-monoxide dehydrogenase large subunit